MPSARLEQLPERLDERELEVFGEAAHVVVTLDRVAVLLLAAGRRAGLYHVRIQRSLRIVAKASATYPPHAIKQSVLASVTR